MSVKVHVNSHVIRANKKKGENNPPLAIVWNSKRKTYHHRVDLIGKSSVVYSPDKPLACGARVWIEADDAVGDCSNFNVDQVL